MRLLLWLRLCAFTVGGMVSTPGRGTRILHASRCGKKINKNWYKERESLGKGKKKVNTKKSIMKNKNQNFSSLSPTQNKQPPSHMISCQNRILKCDICTKTQRGLPCTAPFLQGVDIRCKRLLFTLEVMPQHAPDLWIPWIFLSLAAT